jgi:hypothetical protein
MKGKAIARYVGDSFPAQVEKIYIEMGGKPFQPKTVHIDARQLHARAHGLPGK